MNPTHLKAQYEGSFQLEGMTEATYYRKQFDWTITTGVGLNYWFSDHIAINYEIQLGYDSRYGFALNTGLGQVASGFIFSELANSGTTSEELYVLGVLSILTLIVPEGITLAINPEGGLVFMPYLRPLEIHYFHDDSPHFRCSFEAGLRLHYALDNNGMALRPKLGVRYIYDQQRLGIQVGVGIVFGDSNY